jgi:hypothetical protein
MSHKLSQAGSYAGIASDFYCRLAVVVVPDLLGCRLVKVNTTAA